MRVLGDPVLAGAAVLATGFCAGLAPGMHPGDLVVAEEAHRLLQPPRQSLVRNQTPRQTQPHARQHRRNAAQRVRQPRYER
ncbi:hypothetical protein Saa2_04688 [Streptomyces acidiscabies]|nr:hypothetical protein Saa2_04688 [Streptomyces acidiscabies]